MERAPFDYQQHIAQLLVELGADATSAPTTRLPHVIPNPDSVSVHLDLKDWVDINRARLKRTDGPRFQPAYKYLQQNVASGAARVVLSGALYIETTLRIPDVRRRTHLADAMSELSRFNTLNARHVLLEAEIESALHCRLGRPAFPRKVQIFGRGVHYAFSGKTYAAQLDDGGSGLTHKLFEANPLDALKLLVYMNELFEWGLLRGPGGQLPDTRNLDGLRAMDDDRLALEREFASALQDNAKLRRARRQHVLLRELYHELGPEFVKGKHSPAVGSCCGA